MVNLHASSNIVKSMSSEDVKEKELDTDQAKTNFKVKVIRKDIILSLNFYRNFGRISFYVKILKREIRFTQFEFLALHIEVRKSRSWGSRLSDAQMLPKTIKGAKNEALQTKYRLQDRHRRGKGDALEYGAWGYITKINAKERWKKRNTNWMSIVPGTAVRLHHARCPPS